MSLLFGWSDRAGNQFVVGPRVMDQLAWSDGARPVNQFYAGSSVGFTWWLSDRVALQPQMVVMGSPLVYRADRGAVLWQLGTGFVINDRAGRK